MDPPCWTISDLYDALEEWQSELEANDYPRTTISTYIGRSETFLRYLEGKWQPTGPRR